MEIRLVFGQAENRIMRSLAVTMRTPGHDLELAIGFLITEGIIRSAQQVTNHSVRGVDRHGVETGNILRVELSPDIEVDLARLQRNFFTHSSCGVCGKSSLEALEIQGIEPFANDAPQLDAAVVHGLCESLQARQPTFKLTGGLHAAALARCDGTLVQVREDVGRHNAVDKLIGYGIAQNDLALDQLVMVNSGRVSFEIMQKALVARIPFVVAVGAPTSLAVDMAQQYRMTLIGFASTSRMNIYAGEHRISNAPPHSNE